MVMVLIIFLSMRSGLLAYQTAVAIVRPILLGLVSPQLWVD
jgi:hypothetical protein